MSDDLAAIPADQALRRAAERIERCDAEALLLHALGRDRAWLFMHGRDAVPLSVAQAFEALVQRREAGEPVAYLTGSRGFWTLDLAVSPATLIPALTPSYWSSWRWNASTPRRAVELPTWAPAVARLRWPLPANVRRRR